MKKIFTSFIISSAVVLASAAPSFSRGVYILCYHAFLEKKDPYSFSAEQFSNQLRKLKSSGFTFVTFDDVISGRIDGNRNILISIDDGNKSVFSAYYSIMKPMGIKPLLGIYPAIIGRVKYAMTWEQVKKLADDGCYIASHGYHHMFLSEKYYKEDQDSFLKEIYLSKKILEQKLGRNIEAMVYPFGVNSSTAINELKKAGYKYGMTIVPGISATPFRDNFQIKRYLMTKGGQSGIIARITRQSKNMAVEQNMEHDTNHDITPASGYTEKKPEHIDYPARIRGILSAAVVQKIEPKETEKNTKKIKFKPFKHTGITPSEKSGKHRKITTENEKKNRKRKKAV